MDATIFLACCLQGDPGSVFDKSSMLAERISDANRSAFRNAVIPMLHSNAGAHAQFLRQRHGM